MFRYGRPRRPAREATTPPFAAVHLDCDMVCDAEQTVRRAWEAILLERSHRMESAIQAALANRDSAERLMTMARCNGDPSQVSAARTNLREATDLARRNTSAAEHIRRWVRSELDLLASAQVQHARTAPAGQADRRGPETAAQPGTPADVHASVPRIAAARRLRGLARWTGRLVRARTAARRP